jgi:hypothetical protein
MPVGDLAALRAVVGGRRHTPVTDVLASFGVGRHGPEFLCDTRTVTSMRGAFENLGTTEEPDDINVRLWDTSNVTDMSRARRCHVLRQLLCLR